MDSSGSAMKENETHINSLQGHLSKLNSAWQEFAKNTVNSSFVKGLLDIGTALIKITDGAGGLVPVLTTIIGLFAMFKTDAIAKSLSNIGKSFTSVHNGFKILKQHLIGAKNAEVIYMDATAGATTATNLLVLSVGSLVAAFSIAIQIYNSIKNAREEATEALLTEAQEAQKDAKSKEEQIEQTKEQLETLKQQRDQYLKVAEAQGIASDNNEYLQSKQAEIDKTNENIEALKKERKEKIRSSVVGVGQVSGGSKKSYELSMSTGEWLSGGLSTGEKYDKHMEYAKALASINNELAKYKDNIGAYKNALDDQIKEYEKIIGLKNSNNENTEEEYKIYDALKRKLSDISEDYDNAEKKAKVYYEAVKSGFDYSEIGLSEDDVKWMQEFYDLTDNQIELLKEGQDVKRETTEDTEELSSVEEYLKGVLAEQAEIQQRWREELEYSEEDIKSLNTEIDNMQSAYGTLASAINEYNSTGGLSIDTLQSLLSLNSDYLSALELVNGKLQINKKYEEAHKQILQQDTLALIENAAMEDLKAQATGTAGQVAESAAAKIKEAGLDGKEAGEYAKEGAAGFIELAGGMAQAGMVDLNAVDVNAWANKWAGITKKITGLVSNVNLTSNKFTGSTSKSGKTSKKTQEEYKATIDTLYQYENALDNAKDEVDRLKDALSDADSYEEQERYIKQLIEALNNQIAKTQELKNAQSGQIQDYINQLRAQGFAIDYNAGKNELYINNMQHLADFSGDSAKSIEKIIKKIQDLNSNNRTLDGSVRDLTGSVKDYYDQLAEIPEKKLEKFNALMKEFQQSQLDAVQDQIDDLKREMEKDPRLAALEKEIEALEKQNDTIDKQKEMEEKLLAVEEARQKLENQRKQKTLQVYSKEAGGWTWMSDPDAIKDAENELKDAQDALNEQIKDDKLDKLKEEQEAIKKSYQDQIDSLESFLDDQNYIIDKANREGIQSFEDLRKKLAEFGLDSAENLKKASDWLNQYNDALSKLNQTATTALSNSTAATNGLIYSSATQNRIDQALSGMNIDTTMASVPVAKYDKIDQGTSGQNIYIDTIELPNVSNANEFVEALKDLPRLATTQSSSRK